MHIKCVLNQKVYFLMWTHTILELNSKEIFKMNVLFVLSSNDRSWKWLQKLNILFHSQKIFLKWHLLLEQNEIILSYSTEISRFRFSCVQVKKIDLFYVKENQFGYQVSLSFFRCSVDFLFYTFCMNLFYSFHTFNYLWIMTIGHWENLYNMMI